MTPGSEVSATKTFEWGWGTHGRSACWGLLPRSWRGEDRQKRGQELPCLSPHTPGRPYPALPWSHNHRRPGVLWGLVTSSAALPSGARRGLIRSPGPGAGGPGCHKSLPKRPGAFPFVIGISTHTMTCLELENESRTANVDFQFRISIHLAEITSEEHHLWS